MLLLAASALTGCSDDKYDVDGTNDNLVYIAGKSLNNECSVIVTPAGVFGHVGADIDIKLQYLSDADVHVSAKVTPDQQLVDKYNNEHKTNYVLPSASVLQAMAPATADIKAGSTTASVSIGLDDSQLETFNTDGSESTQDLLVPVSISYDGADGKHARPIGLSKQYNIAYLVIDVKHQLINDDAESIPGTKGDVQSFSVVSADNLDPAGYSGLFGGGWNASWPFLAKKETASFTLDLGEVKDLTAFGIESYVQKSISIAFSTDGDKWSDIGSTAGHNPVYDRETYDQAYVLYGAVKCRYLKFDFTLDMDSWAWSYGSYAAVSGLYLYFQ